MAGRLHGVAKRARILSSPVLSASGHGTMSTIVDALDHLTEDVATERGSVVVMSLGGGSSRSLRNAVRRATEAGIIVIVAAGNDHDDACDTSPANAKEAITVGSHGPTGKRSDFSNFGPCVTIYAPGERIRSAYIPKWNSYRVMGGTSMATPMVAGVVAMLMEQNPRLTSQEATRILQRAAKQTRVSNVPNGDEDRAVMSLLRGAPCILETDQECIYLKGRIRTTCLLERGKKDSCRILQRETPWRKHPIITSRREGHLHIWLYPDASMEEGERSNTSISVRESLFSISTQEFDLIPMASATMVVKTPADPSRYDGNATRFPQEVSLVTKRNGLYELSLSPMPVNETSDRPFALFISMPRDCNTMEFPCNGHGWCSNVTGTCDCKPPYFGPLCAESTEDPLLNLPGRWWKWLFGGSRNMICIISAALVLVAMLVLVFFASLPLARRLVEMGGAGSSRKPLDEESKEEEDIRRPLLAGHRPSFDPGHPFDSLEDYWDRTQASGVFLTAAVRPSVMR